MPLTGDVEIRQNGIVVSARDLTATSKPLDVAINDAAGNQLSGFDSSRPSGATLTQPTVTNTSSVILAANANRRQFQIFNDSGKKVYVALKSTGATTTVFSFTIPAGGFYESSEDGYTGDISAVVASGSIVLQITEVTTT